ncbi:MAG TPA: tetratricopeptide repeat protein [Bryobacteraceae bacterium]|nr:tetratricopeptide repeat protein [Bryobacteraceae bacterium]
MIRTLLVIAFATTAWPQSQELALKSRQARELMAAGRYADAIPIYKDLVKAVPNEPRLLMNLGLAQQMAGRCSEAVVPLATAAKAAPELFPAWVTLGVCYMEMGNTARAIPPLEKAVSLAPREAEPQRMLAAALVSAGRLEAAVLRFRQLAQIEPSDPSVWYGLGKACEALSERAFGRLSKTAPDSAYTLALGAEAQLSRKQYAPAFALYKKALERKPGLRGANAALAAIYRATGHPDWAAASERKEAALPKANCAIAKQECAFRDGRYLDATRAPQTPAPEHLYWQSRAWEALAGQAFSKLASLPPSVESRRLNAQLAAGRDNPMEAAKELREAIKMAPGDRQLRAELAVALHDARDHAGAREVLTELLKEDPGSPLFSFMLGDTLLELGEVEKAVAYLEKGARRGAQARAALGMAYARSGQLAKALPLLEAGAASDTDGRIHFQLARAYREAGQADRSKAAMEKYQQLQARPESEQPQITGP